MIEHYSSNKKIVNKIEIITINFFQQNRIGTVIKHIPGHGLSKKDSHLEIPYIFNKNLFRKK